MAEVLLRIPVSKHDWRLNSIQTDRSCRFAGFRLKICLPAPVAYRCFGCSRILEQQKAWLRSDLSACGPGLRALLLSVYQVQTHRVSDAESGQPRLRIGLARHGVSGAHDSVERMQCLSVFQVRSLSADWVQPFGGLNAKARWNRCSDVRATSAAEAQIERGAPLTS